MPIVNHIPLTCRWCFYHSCDICRIRLCVYLSVVKTVDTALITSMIDYCNSLLYNVGTKDILNLQCVHNYLATVVTRSPLFSHSVPLLKSHNLFPVQSRIIFKLSPITHQTLSSGEPCYFSPCFLLYPSPESFAHLVFIWYMFPSIETHAGTRSVSTVWNSFPEDAKW